MTENALRYVAAPLLAALLISCSSGSESGDVYEHTTTTERIEIDTVGGCGAIVAAGRDACPEYGRSPSAVI